MSNTNLSKTCSFILPICYSELRWKKKKASLLGEAFLRLGSPSTDTAHCSLTPSTDTVHRHSAVSDAHSAASASSSAESASHSAVDASTSAELHLTLLQSSGFDTAESASNSAESVTNTVASQLIQCRSVSLSSISTTFLTPRKSITRRKGGGGGGGGVPHHHPEGPGEGGISRSHNAARTSFLLRSVGNESPAL